MFLKILCEYWILRPGRDSEKSDLLSYILSPALLLCPKFILTIVMKSIIQCFKGLRTVCLPSSFPDANWNGSKCELGKILLGSRLRSWVGHHLQLLEGFHTLSSCQTTCCQRPTCDAFWFLENMCIQVNCTVPGTCQANKTGFSDSVLVFLRKSKSTEHLLNFHMEGDVKTWSHKWLDWDIPIQRKKRLRRSFQKWRLAGNRVQLLRRDLAESSRSSQNEAERLKDRVLRHLVADRAAPEKENQKQDLLKNGQNPREQNPRSPLPPKSSNVNGSQDADSDSPQVSVCCGWSGAVWDSCPPPQSGFR